MQTLGPHVAALGVRIYSGSAFPKAYRRSVFVAQHGSWRLKRKADIGHRVGHTLATRQSIPETSSALSCITARMAAEGWDVHQDSASCWSLQCSS